MVYIYPLTHLETFGWVFAQEKENNSPEVEVESKLLMVNLIFRILQIRILLTKKTHPSIGERSFCRSTLYLIVS